MSVEISPVVPTVIAVSDHTVVPPRKIAKIIPYRDGGFAVMVPYNRHRTGYFMMHEVKYGVRTYTTEHRHAMKRYTLDDHVKLSFHPDGFVQFSSLKTRIISGRDGATRSPKAMGIVTSPFSMPIESGPSFGITAWGLNDFDALETGTTRERIVILDEWNLAYLGSTDPKWNSYVIAGWLLDRQKFAPCVFEHRGNFWTLLLHGNFRVRDAHVPLRIIPLQSHDVFIGIQTMRIRTHFPTSSGFTFGGPAQSVLDGCAEASYKTITAFYPVESVDCLSPSLAYQVPVVGSEQVDSNKGEQRQ